MEAEVAFEVILSDSAGASLNDGDNNATYVPNNTPDYNKYSRREGWGVVVAVAALTSFSPCLIPVSEARQGR